MNSHDAAEEHPEHAFAGPTSPVAVSPRDLREAFFSRIQEAFYPGEFCGTIQFFLKEDPAGSYYVSFAADRVELGFGEHPAPAASVGWSRDILARLVAGEALDFRAAGVIEQLELNGDIAALVRLSQLLMPATSENKLASVFREAEATTRDRLVHDVERLDAPQWEAVLDGLRASRPMLVRNALAHWPAVGWGLDGFTKHFGKTSCRFLQQEETIEQFLARGSRGDLAPETYSRGTTLPREMHDFFAPPFAQPRSRFKETQLWLGSGPTHRPVTELHRDASHGLLGHVVGVKKFLLYPPHHAEFLYPYANFGVAQACRVKPWEPDFARFPLFARARGIEVSLEPGDLLVTPRGWFHEVYASRSPLLSVSFILNGEP